MGLPKVAHFVHLGWVDGADLVLLGTSLALRTAVTSSSQPARDAFHAKKMSAFESAHAVLTSRRPRLETYGTQQALCERMVTEEQLREEHGNLGEPRRKNLVGGNLLTVRNRLRKDREREREEGGEGEIL